MEKKNQLKSCCKKMLSSRQAVGRDLPHPMSLLNRKQQPYFMREAEDPRQKLSGMTNFFNNGNICPTLYSVQKHYGMTSVGRGFTLIELLVVVLIIGILAAVAVPHYQFAVLKSKYTKIKIYANTLYNAVLRYHLANGSWPPQIDDLDVDLPGQHFWGNHIFLTDGTICYIWYDGNGNNGYIACKTDGVIYEHNFQKNTNLFCQYEAVAAKANLYRKLCQQETQDNAPTTTRSGHIYYKYL